MCCWVMRMAEYIHGSGRCSMERGQGGADSRSLRYGEPQGCLGSRRLCGWKLSRAQRKSAELGSRVDAVLCDRFATPAPVPLAWLFTALRCGQEVGRITFSAR